MSLRLALVIDGDPAGAKKALEETGKAVESLATKAKSAGDGLGQVAKSSGSLAGDLGKASDAVGGIGEGLSGIARDGDAAGKGLEAASSAAGAAAGGFSALGGAVSKVAVSFAAGLGVGLLTSAFDTAIGKAAEFARGIVSDTPRIEADLKSHAALVRSIKDAYGEASGAASSYGNNSKNLLKFNAQQDEARLKRDLADALPDLEGGRGGGRSGGGGLGPLQGGAAGPFGEAISKLRREAREGKADIIAFRDEVGKIASALPQDSAFRPIAEKLRDQTDKAAELQEELRRTQDLLKGIDGDAQAAATALGGTADKYGALGTAAGGAVQPVTDTAAGVRAAGEAGSAASGSLDATAGAIAATGSAAGSATGQVNALADALRRTASAPKPGAVATVPVPSRAFAGGGEVFGAGSATSDSIPAMLSNGEFVVNAAATSRFRPLLHAINSGALPGYASGGTAGAFPAAPSAASGASPVVVAAGDFELLAGALIQFGEAVAQGTDVMDALEQAALSFIEKLLNEVLDNLSNGSGGSGGLSGSFFSGGFVSPFAQAAISNNVPGLFANGAAFGRHGIVDTPTLFPFADGIGLMGEAGPEAILPLSRGADGRLGVAAALGGGSAGGYAGPLVVVNNNSRSTVRTEQEDDGRGGRRAVLVVEDQVAGMVSRPGSRVGGALASSFGLRRSTVRS